MKIARFRSMAIDAMLLLCIAGLSAFLLWPLVQMWQNRVRPGAQVCQRCVLQQGHGDNAVPTEVGYLLYLPAKYDASSKWPLVVSLHGTGGRGHDPNVLRQGGPAKLADQNGQLDFILLTPQCPENSSWSPELVVALIEHISSSCSVDRDRVYLTGYSMGGFGTWQTACFDPARFAAIAPLAGGGDPSQAQRLISVPIWAFHGAKDEGVSLDASRSMVDAVRKCGGRVEFTVYPDLGHGICEVTYQDPRLYEWLLAQRRSRQLK